MLLAGSIRARAASFDVNTTDDGADAMPGDGVCATATGMCSLRAAVQEANAMSDLDMINLPGGTYTLSVTGAGEDQAATGDLDILADVMIARSGGTGDVIINGSGDRLFDVFAPANVTISNVTIENGNAGAEAGGAIRNAGTLMLNGVTMTHNTAADGGGFANAATGSAQLVNVTIAGNTATDRGGAIDNPKMGTLQLLNVTVSGNSAHNGNGIGNLGNLTLKNTIVANGMSNNCYGMIPPSNGHNLDSGSTCFGALASDLTSTDPMLGPLQDNGGFTFTKALLPGSPAIDAGDDMDCPPTDQRGQPRPADGNMDGTSVCDIGAYEVQGPVVPTGTPSPSATPTDTPTPTQTSPVPTPTLGGPGIVLGSATGFPGAQVTFDATLSTGGALVGTAQNDISFDNLNTPIGTGTHGEPDCFVNFALGKASSFNFLPNMCVPGTCDMVRAAIVALSPPISPIPDGSTLYTCTVNIAADAAPGQYPLMISRVVLGDPGGTPVPNPTGVNGRIIVVPVPTATATPTVTSSPTSTATDTPTVTPTVTATPSATATFTPTRLPCAGDCDGSGMVNIDDLVKIAAIALGDASLTTCPNADVDRNQKIDIEEVVAAVDKALHGCPL